MDISLDVNGTVEQAGHAWRLGAELSRDWPEIAGLLSQLAPYRYVLPERNDCPVEYAAFTDRRRMQILVYVPDIPGQHVEQTVSFSVNVAAQQVVENRLTGVSHAPELTARHLGFSVHVNETGSHTKFSVLLKASDICLLVLE